MRTAARRRARLCVARLRATRRSRSRSSFTRCAIRRRSVSSCVSPGPRRPMPPFCRSRWVQPPTRRVAMCFSCASSTCSLPSALRARCAKMSRIRLTRSTTRHSSACSRLRCCTPDSAWSKMTRSAPVSRRCAAISSTLPRPANSAGSGRARRPPRLPTTVAPADVGERRDLGERARRGRRGRNRARRRAPCRRSPDVRTSASSRRSQRAQRAWAVARGCDAQRRVPARTQRGGVRLRLRGDSDAASRPGATARPSRSRACRPSA